MTSKEQSVLIPEGAPQPDDETIDTKDLNHDGTSTFSISGKNDEEGACQNMRTPGDLSVEDTELIPKQAKKSIASNVARFISRHPRLVMFAAISFVILMIILDMFVAGFELATESQKGWKSRGTAIAKRGMQHDIIRQNRDTLFRDSDGDSWKNLTTTVLEGYIDLDGEFLRSIDLDSDDIQTKPSSSRHMEESTCDSSWYSSPSLLLEDNLHALWKATSDDVSILNHDIIEAICDAEEETMEVLRNTNLCGSCSSTGKDCLKPYSLIFVIRQYLDRGDNLSCAGLAAVYSMVEEQFTQDLVECVDELRASNGQILDSNTTVCPEGFSSQLVPKDFGVDGNSILSFSTSYFHTAESDSFDLFSTRDEFGQGSVDSVTATYDTNAHYFNEYTVDEYVQSDLVLALISAILAFVVIAIHTGSPWLVILGAMQIIFAVPVAYFVYRFVFGIHFFPVMNFVGLFVSAALGADNLFVASDKWKIFRTKYPEKSTEDIAAMALPDAALAMLLTASTTSVAFFATCVSPIATVFCFAIFCGLMVVFNYVLNCFLVFPGLCIYDEWLLNNPSSCIVSFQSCKCWGSKSRASEDEIQNESNTNDDSMMKKYYRTLHAGRWPILISCLVGLGISSYFAQTIDLPEKTKVQLLSASHPLEELQNDKKQLLSSYLRQITKGSPVDIYFGVAEEDTGDRNDPESLSTLELDNDFDPSPTDAQQYLLDFCDRLFDEPFAYKPNNEYVCSINRFDNWLGIQSLLPQANRAPEYDSKCKGAGSLPMPEVDFHSCFIYYSQHVTDTDVLQWDGKVKILTIRSGTNQSFDSGSYAEVREMWKKFEAFLDQEAASAPSGVNKFFHTSALWWWNDIFRSMMNTGLSSLYIAFSFAFVVTFLSSRSVVCSIVSVLSIFFILATATAVLVGLGWELGFIEWICFAILVGISADFVIHFSHSYTHLAGVHDRTERTQHTLVNMGPSILGATFTTFAVAFMMLFCKVIFFIRFAQLLIVTISFSLVGSFVFFIVIMDIFGPAAPTKTMDTITSCLNKEEK